jgi:hypothetical protein
MSKKMFHPILLFLAALLVACNTLVPQTPAPNSGLSSPNEEESSPIQTTTTPEIFNPVDPSPTPSNSDLPLTCQVTDLNVQVDRANGYCFAYPLRFTFGEHPMFGFQAAMGPAVGSDTEPVFATFEVETGAYDANQSLDGQVDEFLKSFTTVAPDSLTHTRLTVAGEPAVMVDNVPVQLSWRIVFVAHLGRLYRLMYWPVDVEEAKTDLDELYQTSLGSFSFVDAP